MSEPQTENLDTRIAPYLEGFGTFPRSRRRSGWRHRRRVALGTGLATIFLSAVLTMTLAVGHRQPSAEAVPVTSPTPHTSSTPVSVASSPPVSHPGRVIPWAPLPPGGIYPTPFTPAPTTPLVPAAARPCTGAQLEGSTPGPSGAGGHTDQPIVLRNRSSAPCSLTGYPDVRILDARGNLLAEAAGAANRGTFFADGDPTTVALPSGTPALPTSWPGGFGSPGQAFINVEWYDCNQPRAATAVLDLPGGGGRLVLPYPYAGAHSAGCDSGYRLAGVTRGPFRSAGPAPAPGPSIAMAISITAPSTVARDTTLVYVVTLSDPGPIPYELTVCPDYVQFLGDKQAVTQNQLNCRPAGVIGAGDTVSFEMHLPIPGTARLGRMQLAWNLLDNRVADGLARADVEVTG